MSNEAQNGNFAKPILSAVVKTHFVIDVIYNDTVFAGTKLECENWKSEQGFGYKIVPMTKEELLVHNY
jgi:hypothetical protein